MQFLGCAARFVGGVDSAKELQLPSIETLRTQGNACHAGGAVLGELSAFDRARICLERNLDAFRKPDLRSCVFEQAPDGRRRKQAGSSPAQEDAAQRTD